MDRPTEDEVQAVLPLVRHALDVAFIASVGGKANAVVLCAAWQVALIEKAAELAKKTFATSRNDFARAAIEFYQDDS